MVKKSDAAIGASEPRCSPEEAANPKLNPAQWASTLNPRAYMGLPKIGDPNIVP